MDAKVVYNGRHGGFSISKKCAEFMAQRGCTHAQELLKRHDEEAACVRYWRGFWKGNRHDPHLVAAVESIGFGSGADDGRDMDLPIGRKQQLRIAKVTSDRYFIKEYDGLETVVEPKDINWTLIN